ncbi:hypothetical protein ABFS82_11G064800 [Erythranthe guttata]|uniref:uncharacterized protein LOC105965464 n=1 Tax=Erythranthe guttata TaxID=4155 RepID=UPI00064E095A|nr:PREDICTED: uncharacterized protein LOC105965464 [Erythranthe guttata]|eukprot:XP_012845461.1 PREDICTED: uncharacterized protein LOC105965464 [Erythranthe guttata]
MVKRRREPDFNGANTETADNRTVFVDTSLDTHLAVTVSNSDTVSDFKRKTALEHMRCFPEIGEIHIHSLKVKRRAVFYHLPETMLVRSALQAGNSSWFLSADASATPARQLNQNSLQLDPSYGVKMDAKNIDDNNCRDLLPVVNVLQALPMPLPDGVSEKNLASEMIPACEVDKSLEKAIEIPSNSYSEEDCIGTGESRAKKKRKISHTEDVCCDPSLKDTFALSHLSGNDISLTETVGSGNSTVDAVKEATGDIVLYQQNEKPNTSNATDEVSGSRNDQCDIESGVGLEGKSAPDTAEEGKLGSTMESQNILDSDTRKENTLLEGTVPEDLMASKLEYELGQDVIIEHSGGVSVRVPDSSGAMEDDVISDGSQANKMEAQQIQDTTDMEQTAKDDSINPCTENHEVDKMEVEKGLSLNCDREISTLLNSKDSDHADPDLMPNEASLSSHVCHANVIVEPDSSGAMGHVSSDESKKKKKKAQKMAKPEISSGGRKKSKRKGKKEKKSATSNIEKSGIEQTDNGGIGSSELLCAPTDPIPEETHKEESILYHKEMDVNIALLDSSTQDPNEEVKDTDKKEAEFSILTQTKQALDGVDTGNKTVEEKTQLSAAHAHLPAVVEFTDVEKDIKTSEGKIEKSKRRKKRKHAESDVQENLPSKDQKVDIEALTTEENLNGFVNSEQKRGHEASLQVLSSKGEEKLEEIHTAPVITDDPAKTSENGGVGINFKEYFLPGQNKEITDSGDKTEEMRTSKNVRDDVLPSVGVSTDLHNSIKKTKSKRSEKKTRVTKDSGSRQGDSAQNCAFDEVISKPSKRSSKSRVNEKNPSLDKSSSKKTETFHERRGNKRLHSSLNVTDKLVMKTSKKKSMLTIPGAIFQDNSGESSADDNGNVHLKGSIASPPDSSSESDNAIEKGSNDVEGRSTGRKSISEVDISASKNMTMDLILRSSKRFKKAKLNAYDNGYDDSENLEEVQEEGKAADIGLSK